MDEHADQLLWHRLTVIVVVDLSGDAAGRLGHAVFNYGCEILRISHGLVLALVIVESLLALEQSVFELHHPQLTDLIRIRLEPFDEMLGERVQDSPARLRSMP